MFDTMIEIKQARDSANGFRTSIMSKNNKPLKMKSKMYRMINHKI